MSGDRRADKEGAQGGSGQLWGVVCQVCQVGQERAIRTCMREH